MVLLPSTSAATTPAGNFGTAQLSTGTERSLPVASILMTGMFLAIFPGRISAKSGQDCDIGRCAIHFAKITWRFQFVPTAATLLKEGRWAPKISLQCIISKQHRNPAA